MAEKLGIPILDFYRKIFIDDYAIQMDSDRPLSSPTSLSEALNTAVDKIGFESKYHEPGTKTLPDGRLHGIGLVAHLDRHGTTTGGRGAILNVRRDGTFLITTGMSAFSGGPHSQVPIVAEVLGVSYDKVQMGSFGDPDVSMEGGGQYGSTSAPNNGAAAYMAAMDVKEQCFALAAEELEVNVEDLDVEDGVIFVKSDPSRSVTYSDVASDNMVGIGKSWGTVLRKPVGDFPVGTTAWHRTGCAGAYEVAVDPETGEVEILDFVNVCDAGRVLDRHACEGQYLAGLWVQSAMKGRLWNVMHDPGTGAVLHQTYIDDKLPTSMDVDDTLNDMDHSIMLETIGAVGPFGANGIGEPAASAMMAAYFMAISNAIGVWIDKRPVTPQLILKLLGKA
jgi:CO/xanthine dehydrogenase Mo-binding subunit